MNIAHSNTHQSTSLDQKNWREKFLQRILVIAAVIGILAVIPAVLGTDDALLQAIYIGVYVTIVVATVFRLPYLIKAGIFVALPLILGIASLSETGIRGDSLFFLLAFVTLSTLLIGPRSGIVTIIISELIIITTGYLILGDHYTLSDEFAFAGDLTEWITAGATQLLISLVVITGLRMLQDSIFQTQLQNEIMVAALRESQVDLENRVELRTKELARKTDQLSASTFVARQAAEIQDLDSLLSSTVNLIAKNFNLYHTGIYLINERGDFVVLQAASSEGGNKLLQRGYRLPVGMQSSIGFAAVEKKPRIVLKVNRDNATPELPDTRSELSLPLIVRNKLIGVLDLQSAESDAFQHDDVDVFQTLADQIAVAIENVRLLNESQRLVSQLEIASGAEVRENWQSASPSRKLAYHYSATGLRPTSNPAPSNGRNLLEVPLLLRGQEIGKIALKRKDDFQNFTPQEESVATEVATQTALALENIRLVEHTRQRAERERAIASIANRIRETMDLEMVLRTTAREIQSTMNLQEAEVRLITDAETGNITNPNKELPHNRLGKKDE
jgi:GAF domain-containing protein